MGFLVTRPGFPVTTGGDGDSPVGKTVCSVLVAGSSSCVSGSGITTSPGSGTKGEV